MNRACQLTAGVASVAAVGVCVPSAMGVQGRVNGFGVGAARASIWSFPNQPPATPNFFVNNEQAPIISLGPGLPGANPRTELHFQAGANWRTMSTVRAVGGDTVDWHSMLPHATATAVEAEGTIDVVAAQPLGGNTRIFTVTWRASDPGVAMHIGWFENGQLLFETPVMIGPFDRVDTFTVTSLGAVEFVQMEVSAAAKSIIPGPGGLAVLGAGGLLVARRRRR